MYQFVYAHCMLLCAFQTAVINVASQAAALSIAVGNQSKS